MESLSDVLANDLVDHSVDLLRLGTSTRRKVRGVLKKLELDLRAKIKEIDPSATPSATRRLGRLSRLLEATDKTIRTSYRENRKILRSEMVELADIEVQKTIGAVNTQVKFDLMNVVLTPEQLKSVASNALVEGAPSAEWWGRQSAALRNRFADQMRIGVLQGENVNQLVQRVRGTATGKFTTFEIDGKRRKLREFAGGLMDTSTREATALVRTSVQQVSNDARFAALKANDDVLKGVQALVTLDNRTSEICMARSGGAWDFDGKPLPESATQEAFPGAPPWHWNCRTTLVPLTKSWEELSKNKKVARRADKLSERELKSTQASMDGQVAGDLTYERWLKKQPKARQLEVLGKGKFELWKKGKITLRDLIDGSGRPLTLAQLRAKVEASNA